jgi:hypothetical protein
MPITLKGVRVDHFSVERKDNGEYEISARYDLLSSEDKVLAKQSIGGYSDMTIQPSIDTRRALDVFLASYNADIGKTLGLDVE